jgi:hypothetical protein
VPSRHTVNQAAGIIQRDHTLQEIAHSRLQGCCKAGGTSSVQRGQPPRSALAPSRDSDRGVRSSERQPQDLVVAAKLLLSGKDVEADHRGKHRVRDNHVVHRAALGHPIRVGEGCHPGELAGRARKQVHDVQPVFPAESQ